MCRHRPAPAPSPRRGERGRPGRCTASVGGDRQPGLGGGGRVAIAREVNKETGSRTRQRGSATRWPPCAWLAGAQTCRICSPLACSQPTASSSARITASFPHHPTERTREDKPTHDDLVPDALHSSEPDSSRALHVLAVVAVRVGVVGASWRGGGGGGRGRRGGGAPAGGGHGGWARRRTRGWARGAAGLVWRARAEGGSEKRASER